MRYILAVSLVAVTVACSGKNDFKGNTRQSKSGSASNAEGANSGDGTDGKNGSGGKDGTDGAGGLGGLDSDSSGLGDKLGDGSGGDSSNASGIGSNGSGGANGSSGTSANAIKESGNPADIVKACSNTTPKVLKKKMFFPSRKDCQWKANGNLGRDSGRLQARETQQFSVPIPKGMIMCDIQMKSVEPRFNYDDSIILTIEQSVLLNSTNALVDLLPKKDGIYTWDWDAVKGKAYSFEGIPYCLGGNSTCNIPRTETDGTVSIDFESKALSPLALKLLGKESLNFSLVSTGDNDDEDCQHTAITFDVSISYVD